MGRIDNRTTRLTPPQTPRPASTPRPAASESQLSPREKLKQAQVKKQQKDSFETMTPNASRFGSGARGEMNRLIRTQQEPIIPNRDGSVTRTRSTQEGKTTRTQELTTREEPLLANGLKYTRTAKTGDQTTKDTYSSDTDAFGRTRSSHQHESTFERDGFKQTRSLTRDVDSSGEVKETQARSLRETRDSRSQDVSHSTTTDARGNRAWRQGSSTTHEFGDTKLTTSRQNSGGTERTVKELQSLDQGKFSVGHSVDRKSNAFKTQLDASLEHEFLPGTADKSLDKKTRSQKAFEWADAVGLRKQWKPPDVEGVIEHDFSADPQLFLGTRAVSTASQSSSVGADGIKYAFHRENQLGVYAERTDTLSDSSGALTSQTKAKAEVRWNVSGNSKYNAYGVELTGRASAKASIEISAEQTLSTKSTRLAGVNVKALVKGEARVSAEVGAAAEGSVKVTADPPTAIIEGNAGVSAVAKAGVGFKASAGPFSVKMDAYASAGAEARATGVLGYDDGKLKIGVGLGAAVGVGGGGSSTVEIDLEQIGEMAVNTATEAADLNGDGALGLDDAKAGATYVANGARRVADGAVSVTKQAASQVAEGAASIVNHTRDRIAHLFGY